MKRILISTIVVTIILSITLHSGTRKLETPTDVHTFVLEITKRPINLETVRNRLNELSSESISLVIQKMQDYGLDLTIPEVYTEVRKLAPPKSSSPDSKTFFYSLLSKSIDDRKEILEKQETSFLEEVRNFLIAEGMDQNPIYDQIKAVIIARIPQQQPQQKIYLVPAQETELKKIGACPLFPEAKEPPLIHVIRDGTIKLEYAPITQVPCTNKYKGVDLVQLRTVNQVLLFKEGGCPGLSVRNAQLVQNYAISGNQVFLQKLYDLEGAQRFAQKHGCPQIFYLEKNELEKWIKEKQLVGLQKDKISVIDNVVYFDPQRLDVNIRQVFNDAIKEAETVLRKIQDGLKQPEFMYSLIVGNGDIRALDPRAAEHWININIIKANNKIELAIVDTITNYHLEFRSYEMARLKFMIDMFLEGRSAIDLFMPTR